MTFHSVKAALRWYAKARKSDGVRSLWPREYASPKPTGRAPDKVDEFLTLWAVARAMEGLTREQHRLLWEHYIDEIPVAYLAVERGRSQSRVYALLSRTRRCLAVRLVEEGVIVLSGATESDGGSRKPSTAMEA